MPGFRPDLDGTTGNREYCRCHAPRVPWPPAGSSSDGSHPDCESDWATGHHAVFVDRPFRSGAAHRTGSTAPRAGRWWSFAWR
ncbi:MAG: hypothetical protein MZV64_09985 [Ignavibacteriales bacterium]|nr:hypothetical protein [Ignavibacteriales bacterium]